MKDIYLLVLVFFNFITSCNSSGQRKLIQVFDSKKADETKQIKSEAEEFVPTEIFCDSIYKNKKYKITVINFTKETSYDEGVYNSIFKFYKLENGKYQELFRDSIQRHFDEVLFEDFNNDNVKDILIENISDVRSNLTYYLYLVDPKTDKLKKIKNFETIKNPHYLPKYDLIDNMVMSGRDWTAFYKINKDSIISFENDDKYIVNWGEDENGNPKNPDKDYKAKLLKVVKILKKQKNYR